MPETAIHKHRHPLCSKQKVRPHLQCLASTDPRSLAFTASRLLTSPRLHPVMPAARISPASFCSVSLFPVE
jgi:hypothetical protein